MFVFFSIESCHLLLKRKHCYILLEDVDLNQCAAHAKRIVFQMCLLCFQQSVLAALYSSEGSVMEVKSLKVFTLTV